MDRLWHRRHLPDHGHQRRHRGSAEQNRPLHQALLSYVVTVMTERLSFASKVIGVLRR
jgi:hypothetical protein